MRQPWSSAVPDSSAPPWCVTSPRKAPVRVLDDLSTGTPANLAGVPGVDLIEADLLDDGPLGRGARPASKSSTTSRAWGCATRSISPFRNHQVNAEGTLRILETSRRLGVDRVVYCSTSRGLRHRRRVPMDEDHPTWPHTVYGGVEAGRRGLHAGLPRDLRNADRGDPAVQLLRPALAPRGRQRRGHPEVPGPRQERPAADHLRRRRADPRLHLRRGHRRRHRRGRRTRTGPSARRSTSASGREITVNELARLVGEVTAERPELAPSARPGAPATCCGSTPTPAGRRAARVEPAGGPARGPGAAARLARRAGHRLEEGADRGRRRTTGRATPRDDRRIPVARPELGEPEWQAIREVIESGWVTQGPKVEEFEAALAAHRRREPRRRGLVVHHGAAPRPGRRRRGPRGRGHGARRCRSSPPPTRWSTRARRRSSPRSSPTPSTSTSHDVERRITRARRRSSSCTSSGLPADIEGCAALARRHGLQVIEDAACAIGSGYHGTPIGAHGELRGFSFHPRKLVTTGDGGMILTSDAAYAERLRLLRQHGMSVNDRVRNAATSVVREQYVEVAWNYRLTDIQAADGHRADQTTPGAWSSAGRPWPIATTGPSPTTSVIARRRDRRTPTGTSSPMRSGSTAGTWPRGMP